MASYAYLLTDDDGGGGNVYVGGWIGDKIGRIRTILVGCAFAIFGATLQTAAQNVAWMICSRIITGIGTGHLNAIVPVWSAETSHYSSRGMFIAMEFTLNIFGVVIAVSIELVCFTCQHG